MNETFISVESGLDLSHEKRPLSRRPSRGNVLSSLR
jgi:hypothetical protein